jgi:hypothetical protein
MSKWMEHQYKHIVKNAVALGKQKALQDTKGKDRTPKLLAIKQINYLKELRNKAKGPDMKKFMQNAIDKLEKDYKKIKEEKITEGTRKWSVKVKDIGYVLVDAGNASEAKRMVGKKLRGGVKDIENISRAFPAKKVSDVGIDEAMPYPKQPNELSNTMQVIKKVVDSKSYEKYGGTLIDLTTASLIWNLYQAVNDSNKAKLNKLGVKALAKLAFKIASKAGKSGRM